MNYIKRYYYRSKRGKSKTWVGYSDVHTPEQDKIVKKAISKLKNQFEFKYKKLKKKEEGEK